jgi:hypothetical protein
MIQNPVKLGRSFGSPGARILAQDVGAGAGARVPAPAVRSTSRGDPHMRRATSAIFRLETEWDRLARAASARARELAEQARRLR